MSKHIHISSNLWSESNETAVQSRHEHNISINAVVMTWGLRAINSRRAYTYYYCYDQLILLQWDIIINRFEVGVLAIVMYRCNVLRGYLLWKRIRGVSPANILLLNINIQQLKPFLCKQQKVLSIFIILDWCSGH